MGGRGFLLGVPLLLGLLTLVGGACRSPEPDTPERTLRPTSVTQAVTATPPPPSPLPAGTFVGIPSTTTPPPTATPGLPPVPVPAGWVKHATNGTSLLIPESWLDLSPLLVTDRIYDGLGPNSRFYFVDDKRTSQNLLSGQEFGSGAFVLGFAQTVPNNAAPEGALTDLLSAADAPPLPVVTLTVGGLPAALTDAVGDPLGLLPAPPAALRLRLLLIATDVPDAYLLFAMGAAPDRFDAVVAVFDFLIETVRIDTAAALIADSSRTGRDRGPIIPGTAVQATLAAARQDAWSFQGQAGHYVSLQLRPLDGNDLSLALLDGNGRVLARSDNGYAGEREVLFDRPLPRSGTYAVHVADFFGETGRYELNLSVTETPLYAAGGDIALGQVVQGELRGSGEDAWRFSGSGGQRITIVLTPALERLDIAMRLVGPDGERLLDLDEGFSGDAEVAVGIVLPFSGTYTILVRDFAARGGAYSLSLDVSLETLWNFYDAGDLVPGEFYLETLQVSEAHAWFFTGFAGDDIRLQVTPLTADLDLDLWLLSPDLERLAMQDINAAGAGELIAFTLPEDGQYVVLVQDYFGDAGRYQINLTLLGNPRLQIAGDLFYQLPVTTSLPVAQTALWYLAVFPDEDIVITVVPLSPETDLVLILKDDTGRTVTRVDNGGPGEVEAISAYVPAPAGAWLVMVEEYLGRGGAYRLEAERFFR